jgi:membrane protease YdiL (CAAX protease family)
MNPALRHTLQVVLRAILALCVAAALPLAHVEWGEPYPGEGQKSFGMVLMFFLVGMGVALVYFIVGTVAQVLLQRRPPKVSLGIDLGLALLLGLLLAYGGVTAHYLDESPTRPEADTTAHAPPPRR